MTTNSLFALLFNMMTFEGNDYDFHTYNDVRAFEQDETSFISLYPQLFSRFLGDKFILSKTAVSIIVEKNETVFSMDEIDAFLMNCLKTFL